jgi:hypothetical protein
MEKEDIIMKRHQVVRLALLVFACVLLLVNGRAPAQISTRQMICPEKQIPAGWIKVDVQSFPAECGGDAWIIEPYTNKIPGSAMTVCADQPTPPGWDTLGYATSTGQCSGGTQDLGNIKSIRRLG